MSETDQGPPSADAAGGGPAVGHGSATPATPRPAVVDVTEVDWESPSGLAVLAAVHGPDGCVVMDPTGAVRFAGNAVVRLLGVPSPEEETPHVVDFVAPGDVASVLHGIHGVAGQSGYHRPFPVQLRATDGRAIDCEVAARSLPGPGGTWTVVAIRAVGERAEIGVRRDRLRELVQDASLRCAMVRWFEVGGVLEGLMGSLAAILGAEGIELAWAEAPGPHEPLRWAARWSVDGSDRWVAQAHDPGDVVVPLTRQRHRGAVEAFVVRGLAVEPEVNTASAGPQGHRAPGTGSAVEVWLTDGTVGGLMRIGYANGVERWDAPNTDLVALIGTILQSTLRRCHAEQKLDERARRDPLTGLPDRNEFFRVLRERMAAPGPPERLGVLYCDLDRFKELNDRLGHAAGDEVLRAVATALDESIRSRDMVARVGGDEFVAICDDLDRGGDGESTLSAVATRLRQRLRQLVQEGSTVGVSVGWAIWDGESDPDALVNRADAAMYRDKRSNRSHT